MLKYSKITVWAAQVEIVKKIKYTNVPGDGC